MNHMASMKTGVFSTLAALFMSVAPLKAQGPQAAADSAFFNRDTTLTEAELGSYKSYQGRDPERPYHTSCVVEVGDEEPLIDENADAIIHIASLTKLITAQSFYYCKEVALREAGSPQARDSVRQEFDEMQHYIDHALIYSNNYHAHKIGMFLENLDLGFINKGIEEKCIERGNYRVFSQIIVPAVLKEAGVKNTVIFNPSGLPPYEFGGDKYAAEEPPDNYRDCEDKPALCHPLYKDPDDYNRSTPRDMVKLFAHIIERYPEVIAITGRPTIKGKIWGRTQDIANTNFLLENSVALYKKPQKGVFAGKTGTSNGAGALSVLLVQRCVNGREKQLVVFDGGHWRWRKGEKKGWGTARDRHLRKVIDHGFVQLAHRLERQEAEFLAQKVEALERKDIVFAVSEPLDSARLKNLFALQAPDLEEKLAPLTRSERRRLIRNAEKEKGKKDRFGFGKKLFARRPEEPQLIGE